MEGKILMLFSLKIRHYAIFGHFFCPFLTFGNTFGPSKTTIFTPLP